MFTYFPLKVRSVMVEEKLQSELTRLRREQNKARQDEVFGVSRTQNRRNTTKTQCVFTNLKVNVRERRPLTTVCSLQRQSTDASGTKIPKQTLPRVRLISHIEGEKN
jgi:hypothetical protein